MKILCVIDSLGSGGAQRQLVNLAIGFKEKGHNVSFLVYSHEPFFLGELIENNIKYYCLEEKNYIKRIYRIRKFIRNFNADVVISFLEVPNFLNCVSAIGGRKWKVITGERSSNKRTFFSKKGRIFAWFQRYSDVIVCNSDNACAMWKKYYPKYDSKLKTIYNAVPKPNVTSRYIPRNNGKIHIVIAASYQYLKNPIGVIKAISLLNKGEKKLIEVQWFGRVEVINNDTQAYDDAINLIKEHKLDSIIHLNEETKDIANIMNSADVIGLFSKLEGLPNSICEGMILGKPIIMTRVSDYSVLVDSSNGFLCDWDNIESIKNALLSAIELTEDKLKLMGDSSKLKAQLLFSKERIIQEWLDII